MPNTETKTDCLMNDRVVRSLLKNSPVGKKFVSKIISEVIKVPYEEVYNNMRYINDDRAFTSKTVDARTDVMVETTKYFINLEICYTKGSTRERQMDTYNYELYLTEAHKTSEYKNMKQIIQIMIENYDFFHRGQFCYKVVSMEESLHILENDFITKYHLNLDSLKEMSYNSIKEEKNALKKMMYMFVGDKDKIDKAYEGDDFMESVVEEARGIAGELKIPLYLSEEEIRRLDREEAVNEGAENAKKEMIVNMLKKNVDIKFISEIAELSVEEVEKIIKEHQDKKQNKY